MASNIDFSGLHNEVFDKLADKYNTPMRAAHEPEFIAVAAIQSLDAMGCKVDKNHKTLIVASAEAALIRDLRDNEVPNYQTIARNFLYDYMSDIKGGIERQMGNTVESTVTQDKDRAANLGVTLVEGGTTDPFKTLPSPSPKNKKTSQGPDPT